VRGTISGDVAPGTIRFETQDGLLEFCIIRMRGAAVRRLARSHQLSIRRDEKVVRVNDVALDRLRRMEIVELRLTAGGWWSAGAVRRCCKGVGVAVGRAEIAEPAATRTILWEFVNLIDPDPFGG